jgi:hypothetical protein
VEYNHPAQDMFLWRTLVKTLVDFRFNYVKVGNSSTRLRTIIFSVRTLIHDFFIYSLCNRPVNNSNYMAPKCGMIRWKSRGRKLSCRILRLVTICLGELGKTTKNLSKGSLCPDRDLNPRFLEYEARVLSTQPRCLIGL